MDVKGEDPNEEIVRQQGDPAKDTDFAKLANIQPGSNNEPPAPVPFKITRGR